MKSGTKREYEARVTLAIQPIVSGDNPGLSLDTLADRAAFSRFHFQRLFKLVMEETPGELRRRILLERAAYYLLHKSESVTGIAFDAEFQSLEGFTRAFRRSYGISPRSYRQRQCGNYRLASKNGVHFMALAATLPSDFLSIGGNLMDLIDRLLEHDLWLTRQMLERATNLTDEQLDAPMPAASQAVGFEPEQKTLRELLDRIILAKEVWVAALEHREFPDKRAQTIAGMISRLEVAYPMFIGLARRVRDQDQWDATFVDELCVPPETFSFGGMIAHVLTFGIHRRQLALEVMRGMGVTELGYGDPIEWERSLAPTPS